MSKKLYRELIDELAHFYQTNPERLYDVCNFQFAGVHFSMFHGGEIDENGILLYADCGIPPENLKGTIFKHLMQLNFFIANKRKANFGINLETGHVIFMNRFELPETSIDVLINVLTEIAAYIMSTSQNLYELASSAQNIKLQPSNQVVVTN